MLNVNAGNRESEVALAKLMRIHNNGRKSVNY